MAILFDHNGFITIPEWVSTNGNFDIVFDIYAPSTVSQTGLIGGNSLGGGTDWLVLRGDGTFQLRNNGAYAYPDTPTIPYNTRFEITLRCRVDAGEASGFTREIAIDGVGGGTFGLSGLDNYSVIEIGTAEGRDAEEGVVLYQVQLIDLDSAANSRDYQFLEGSGTTTADSGPGGHAGTLSDFTVMEDAWYVEAPTIGLSGGLQPGAEFTLNYSHYTAVPVSPVTMTDSNDNAITVPVTITDTPADGKHSGTAVGTMPALPSSGTASGLLFGNVTVELTS